MVLQENVVRIMKTDGKVLEYKAPLQVHQVLTDFSGHAISDSLPVLRHLHPNTKLLSGHMYYLVLLTPKPEKKVRFADPEVQDSQERSVVRIKLVISKQELQDMLLHKGGISVDNMLSLVRGEKMMNGGEDMGENKDGGLEGWKPALESIPEVI